TDACVRLNPASGGVDGLPSAEPAESFNRTISLAMLRAERKNHFEIYRGDMKSDIKAQIEIHCKEIRDDIASWRCQTESNMETIRAEFTGRVDKLTAAQKEAAKTQDDMEKSLNDMSDRVVAFEKSYQVLVDDNKRLADKCSDLENRSHRQNIRIVGIAEGIEANDANKFEARFLGEVLGEENFNRAILIDKAHRSLAPKPRIGEKPPAIIARLHYLSDKENIMSLSRAKGKLSFEGSPVHIFPDVSPEVGRQRAAFNQVKAKLRSAGIPHSMQFPARLVLTLDGMQHVFKDPPSAERFIRSNSLQKICTMGNTKSSRKQTTKGKRIQTNRRFTHN
uniref:L1 transposable element RRM domain-containing protein n=1 Tax=Oryzias latipes TaxID=8090 RepID=A0A3P9KZG4_ORYLA